MRTSTSRAAGAGIFSRKSLPRWRLSALVLVHVLFACHYLHWKLNGRTLAPLEFSEALHTLHAGVITLGFLFTAAAIAATAVFGRFFCGWGCHILALQDACAWLLARFRIKPKPVRSRSLAWIPFGVFAYMFIWPQAARIISGHPLPAISVQEDMDGWGSYVTSDLLRAMPDLSFTLITFAVCGFLIVYFLGSRGFCYTVCPYGVFFGWAERLAPKGKIVLSTQAGKPGGGCESCGLCVQNCKSGVNVIAEVKRFGAVIDPNCLKSLDCVAGCPQDALAVAYSPAFPAVKGAKPQPPKRYAFTWVEEGIFALAFALILPVYYGLYRSVGTLLAAAIAVIGGYLAVRIWKDLQGSVPRDASRTRIRFYAALFAALTLHSAYVHAQAFAGDRLFRIHFTDGYPGVGNPDDLRRGIVACAAHLRASQEWGLFASPETERKLGFAYGALGNQAESDAYFRKYLERGLRDMPTRVQYGNLLLAEGYQDRAEEQYRTALDQSRGIRYRSELEQRAAAHSALGRIRADNGDFQGSISHLDSALADQPDDLTLHCNRILASLKAGDWSGAESFHARALSRFEASDCLDQIKPMLEGQAPIP